MAQLPTPPEAPVTATSLPDFGLNPESSSAKTESIAVSPAVPKAMLVNKLSPGGTGSSQSAFTDANSARPPQYRSPRPHPVAMTESPRLNLESFDSTTIPARSTPGTIGNDRTIFGRPVTAKASL